MNAIPILKGILLWAEFITKGKAPTPDPSNQVAKEALKLYCNINKKYPAKLLQALPWNRAYIKWLCDEVAVPLPEPEEQPPYGQCVGVMYAAWGSGIAQLNPGSGNNVPLVSQGQMSRLSNIPLLPGKITRLQYINEKGQPVSASKYLSDGKTFTKPTYLQIYHGGSNSPHVVTFTNSWGQIIREFRRSDGLADVCGSLPPAYSEDPPTDPADFTKIVNIYNYNTDGSIRVTTPVPIVIPVGITGNFDFDFNAGGVDIHFDLGGISYSGGNTTGGTTNNTTNNYYGGGGSNEVFKPEDYEEELPTPEEEEEQQVKKPGIEFVLVTVETMPDKNKTILMKNQNDNTFFAGYFRWLLDAPDGSYGYEEIPVRKKRQVFKNPGYTNGYRLYSVNGAVLSSKMYVIQPPP